MLIMENTFMDLKITIQAQGEFKTYCLNPIAPAIDSINDTMVKTMAKKEIESRLPKDTYYSITLIIYNPFGDNSEENDKMILF